ncbi:MAG: glycosyltransferase family 2 protein [Anaerolineales bacterium]|nr:glycosyltransferase family 2 protein [Anaerolineales bacterium]MCB8953892.1 glycosyltransferase family 2 protein [Ardenticatenales bacterium]
MPSSLDLSIVIPVFNEAPNLSPLTQELTQALEPTGLAYEIIFVDDGSSDDSFAVLQKLQAEDARLVLIRFRRNFGQTAAFAAGFDHARGQVVVTMDADRQNDPADVPVLLAALTPDVDVVNGWRRHRQDPWLSRKLPSRIANSLIAYGTGVRLRDRGCSLRAFRAEVVRELRLYGEMHRFIPELVSHAGFRMAEVPVHHRPRIAGKSKYGLSRTFRVMLDLITILFLRRYGDRPMHLFGSLGLLSGGAGFLLGLWLSSAKIWAGIQGGADGFRAYRLSERPLLLLAVLLIILGVQFLVIGLLSELLVRVYYESQNKPVYHIRDIVRASSARRMATANAATSAPPE